MALSKVDYNSLNVTAAASKALKWNSGADGFETGDIAGALVLLETQTASSSATLSFTSGIDSTYDKYVFKFYDIHPQTDNVQFTFDMSVDTGSNYGVSKVHAFIDTYHSEDGTTSLLGYSTDHDLVGSGVAKLTFNVGNDNDQSVSGHFTLFNPSSTTFVKHYKAATNLYAAWDASRLANVAGYGNTTNAIDAVQFAMSSGNIDSGVIKMYGVT